MSAPRRIGQMLLAGTFVHGGIDAIRNPKPKVPPAREVGRPIADALPVDLPDDTEQLVRLNGAVQVAGGALLVLGRLPRLAALALAASLVPTTAAGHRFWEADDEGERRQQTIHLLKNLSILGGLLVTTADTGSRPSVSWWARRASRRAGDKADAAAARTRAASERARRKATSASAEGRVRVAKGAARAERRAAKGAAKAERMASRASRQADRGARTLASAARR